MHVLMFLLVWCLISLVLSFIWGRITSRLNR